MFQEIQDVQFIQSPEQHSIRIVDQSPMNANATVKPKNHNAKDSIFSVIDELVSEGHSLTAITLEQIASKQRQKHNGYADGKSTISSYRSQYNKKQNIQQPSSETVHLSKVYTIVKASEFLKKAIKKYGLSPHDIQEIVRAISDESSD